jgi:SPP1 gp7 family putative phage head morphogenesis protein
VTDVRSNLLNAYTSGVSRAGMASIVGSVFDEATSSEARGPRLTTRMLSAKSLNYSRAAAIERGGIPLRGAQYSAILDRRTCDLCRKLDEKVIPIEHTDLARFTPPVHHNCRCVWVWITTDEEDFTPTWVTPSATDVDRFGGLVI